MAMNVSMQDMVAARRAVIEEVARRLEISDIYLKDGEALLDEITFANPELGEALWAHLHARQEWFAFTEWIESVGKNGNLEPAENEQLVAYVTAKKATAKTLSSLLN